MTARGRRPPPEGRRAVFVGDLVDRGPASPAVLRLVMDMVDGRRALCVPGNHEAKLLRALAGATSRGPTASPRRWSSSPPSRRSSPRGRPTSSTAWSATLVLDDGKLVVAHAGLRRTMHGRASGAVRAFALYGDTTGETDEFGLPVRYPWADDYRGQAAVVYGHTPVPEPRVGQQHDLHRHRLRVRRQAHRPALARARTGLGAGRPHLLRAGRPLRRRTRPRSGAARTSTTSAGKRIVETRLHGTVTVREENAAAALEVMSRFADRPHWLVYLPPTMSPPATSRPPGCSSTRPRRSRLPPRRRHPLVCERRSTWAPAPSSSCAATPVAARASAVRRLDRRHLHPHRTAPSSPTRARSRAARPRCGRSRRSDLWNELDTDWLVLDSELLPWSAKAARSAPQPVRQRSAPPALASLPRRATVLTAAVAGRRR